MAQSETRRTRGPSIARTTRSGKPTAYAVKKDLWSTRGDVFNGGVKKLGDAGEAISKQAAIRLLDQRDNEAAAPFVLKTMRGKPTLVPASAA